MERKRYMLFCYDQYYPLGAAGDFAGMYDSQNEAEEAGKSDRANYFDILDLDTGEFVAQGW